eukprot:6390411-Pyramimonas_sp.AAC.1
MLLTQPPDFSGQHAAVVLTPLQRLLAVLLPADEGPLRDQETPPYCGPSASASVPLVQDPPCRPDPPPSSPPP